MRERDWRTATVNALSDLLTWWGKREAARLSSAPAANDGVPAPPPIPSTTPAEEGVPSRPRCT